MVRLQYLFFTFSWLIITSCNQNQQEINQANDKNKTSIKNSVFELVSAETSSVTFNNTITENLTTKENLFDFDYFYNGAGVGIADLNNDGLSDIVFTGNQVPSKLYLNKGDFVFEDITEKSGFGSKKNWSNGITFVDINKDGFLDIYISQGGPHEREQRANLLYINQGNLTFIELAESYGLADQGISTQSAFFDFDNDGDLDCIVMNENELYGFEPDDMYRMVKENKEAEFYNSSHLYENNHGKFTDITKKSGILKPIFGLGLIVSDFNKDNFLDFYMASDYYIPDALYINNADGTFSDKIKEYTNQVSFYGMGMDVADINNDNLEDIFVLDMASSDHVRSKTLMASMSNAKFDYLVNKSKFHYQYMFNSLQLNLGNNNYNNVAQMTNVAKTDWSWSVFLTDFDDDEDKDMFVTNGYRRYALDNDFRMKVFNTKKQYNNNVPIEIKQSLYYEMPSEKLNNILFENKGFLEFETATEAWGLNKLSYSNGAAYGDLDNDGDLDLVINNIDETAFIYKNLTSDKKLNNYLNVKLDGITSEPFAKVTIHYNGKSQFIESKRVRGFMSAVDQDVHFGLGQNKSIDTLTVTWLSGKSQKLTNLKANTLITLSEKNANLTLPTTNEIQIFESLDPKTLGLDFTYKENVFDDFEEEILLPYKQSSLGPFITKADINKDGMDDIFIGGAVGELGQLFISSPKGYGKANNAFLEEDRASEDMDAVFIDIDKDGDLDLYVVSGGNEYNFGTKHYADRLYINDGTGNYKKKSLANLANNIFSGKKVIKLDYDMDGDDDLIVGNRIFPHNYPKHAPSTIYRNDNGELTDVTETIAKGLLDFGIINDMVATDFDADGWMDFIAVGEWTGIGLFKNNNGVFTQIDSDQDGISQKGWWFSIAETDINNDGLKDYVIGNVGSNIKFKASAKSPFRVYSNDFDKNGTNDIVLSNEYKGKYVPVRGRECSSQQMPFLLEKFPTFNEFANASLNDIYGNDLEKSYFKEANSFNSILLMNLGNGKFSFKALPKIFQSFPILSTIFIDINNDGFEDAIVAGNIYETEVETPRLDANSGMIMISNGKDGYEQQYSLKQNLQLHGNIKTLTPININNETYILALPNSGLSQLFKFKNK